MKKAIIFDYGGVVTYGGGGNGVAKLFAKTYGLSVDKSRSIMTKPWHNLVRGNSTEDEFWKQVEAELGQPIAPDKRDVWTTWEDMKPNEDMLALIEKLKKDGYIVGMLSNVIPYTANFLKQNGVYDLFDPCILSFEVGQAKPDKDIFLTLLNTMPQIKTSEIIYIDDQQRHLVTASDLGIITILAKSPSQIASEIENILSN